MKYFFIHVGQTAGTSFRNFLEQNINNCADLYGKFGRNLDVDKKTLKNNNLFSSHTMKYGFHEKLDVFDEEIDYQYVALLRHPITRMISAYNYAIKRKWVKPNESVIEYYKRRPTFKTLFIDFFHRLDKNEVSIKKRKEKALENLKKDEILFGFVEDYEEFVELACEMNGWKKMVTKTNKNGRKHMLTDSDIEFFEEELKEEIDFYNQAREIYQEKYKEFLTLKKKN